MSARSTGLFVAVAALAIATMPYPRDAAAQSGPIQTLRGPTPIEETNPPPDIRSQNTDIGRFSRAYRQQPPMVPHKVDQYQVDLRVNQCLNCHDWPYNVQEKAPKVSETHYIDRDGVALDRITRGRWFCSQCHVPQANARALVENRFRSANEVE